MKRIAHILSSGGYSGAENVAIRLIEATPDSYESLYVSTAGPIEKRLTAAGIKHYCVNDNSSSTLRNVIKSQNIDIVYAHDFKASVRTALLFSSVGKISHIHQNPTWFSKVNIKTLLFLFCSLFLSKIVFVSQETLDEFVFSSAIKKKSVVLDNFVDGESVIDLAGIQKKRYQISFLGRFEPVKDPMRFLKIVRDITLTHPDVSTIMIGDGSLMDDVKRYILDHNLEANVEVVGYQDNPYQFLNQAHINVIPSVWEGFGLSAVESMVLGVPVVANAVGGLQTIVAEGCGYLCRSDEEFTFAITALLDNEQMLEEYSKNAMKNAGKYTDRNLWKRNVANILE